MLAFQKESYVELEVELGRHIKVGSECIEDKKEMLLHIYNEFSKVISWTNDDMKLMTKM